MPFLILDTDKMRRLDLLVERAGFNSPSREFAVDSHMMESSCWGIRDGSGDDLLVDLP